MRIWARRDRKFAPSWGVVGCSQSTGCGVSLGKDKDGVEMGEIERSCEALYYCLVGEGCAIQRISCHPLWFPQTNLMEF